MDEDELELECVSCENVTEENEIDMLELDADNTTFEENNVGDQQMQCGQIFISKDRGHLSFKCIFCSVICSKATEFEKHIKCCISDENHAKEKLYIKKEQYEFVSIAENESNGLEDETNHIEDLNEQHSYGNDVGLKSTDRENSGSTINSIDLKRNSKLINNKRVKLKLCKVLCNFIKKVKDLKAKESLESQIVQLDSNEKKMNSPNNVSFNDWTDLSYCELCEKYIETKENIMEHYKNHHAVVDPFMDGTKSFVSYSSSSSEDKFEDEENLKTYGVAQQPLLLEKIRDDPYQCRYCSKRLSRGGQARIDHERIHTGEKPFQCEVCKKCFRSNGLLNSHLKVHTGVKPYSCHICGGKFSSTSNLSIHVKSHLGIKNNKCTYCDTHFLRNVDRRIHERIHTGEKPYQCMECGKCFRVSGRLNEHLKIHTGIRPHKCVQCDKQFFTKYDLKNHSVMHSSERPLSCEICQATFTRRKALLAHKKLHSDVTEYICKICGKGFKQNAGLYSHMKIHGERLTKE